MSRSQGSLTYSGNYEVLKTGPLDAKQCVDTFQDLINPETWEYEGTPYAYKGMFVSVASDCQIDGTTYTSGLYLLKDLDYTLSSNWEKIGGSSSIEWETF